MCPPAALCASSRAETHLEIAKVRPGGLEVAIKAALKDKTGVWFGWSGKIAAQAKIATRKVVHDKISAPDCALF